MIVIDALFKWIAVESGIDVEVETVQDQRIEIERSYYNATK